MYKAWDTVLQFIKWKYGHPLLWLARFKSNDLNHDLNQKFSIILSNFAHDDQFLSILLECFCFIHITYCSFARWHTCS